MSTSKEEEAPNMDEKYQWAEKGDQGGERNRLMFFGTNLAKIPCFKSSFMNGIGAGMIVGIAYNLATTNSNRYWGQWPQEHLGVTKQLV